MSAYSRNNLIYGPTRHIEDLKFALGCAVGENTPTNQAAVIIGQDTALRVLADATQVIILRAQLTAAQAEIARLTSTLITHHPMRNLPKEVTELQDWLDMALDEFQRIHSCPGADSEIQQLCERAQTHIRQHVHVITQRDDALSQLQAAQSALRESEAARRADSKRLDWLLSDPGSIPKLTKAWMSLESPLGNEPYKDPRIGGRAALDLARRHAEGVAK